jgi:23S rRNA pseudouridine1911/1915/1917 synthase
MPEEPLKLAVKPNTRVGVVIVHEDPDLIIVNKPAGLVTQPGKGHTTDSLLNGVFALKDGQFGKYLHNLGERRDYGLLHRLDKETSGLLVIAKTPNAYDQLRRDFEARRVDKEYLCMTRGVPVPAQGVVQARLKETVLPTGDFNSVKKVVISRQGQEAISVYHVVFATAAEPRVALIRVTIKTGRLHQIRAHMLFLNTPVLGDDLYTLPALPPHRGEKLAYPPRLCLHAARLGFKHPTVGKWVHYEAPLPRELAVYAKKVGITLE